MKRLTKKTDDGRYILTEAIVYEFPEGSGLHMPTPYLAQIIDKLGIYEDAEERIDAIEHQVT